MRDRLGTGRTVAIEVVLQTTKPGIITNGAAVSTDSTDATSTNDEDEVTVDIYRPFIVDIQPGATPNAVNITKGGVSVGQTSSGRGPDTRDESAASSRGTRPRSSVRLPYPSATSRGVGSR